MDRISPLVRAPGALLVAVPGAVLLAALLLEHWGGFAPCELCLRQRIPYYAGIPAAAAALLAFRAGRTLAAAAALAAASALYGWGSATGAWQAGAEWGWWEGPSSCGGAFFRPGMDAAAMLEAVKATARVSCTEPALRIAGVSLAGWNALSSAAAAALSGWLAARALKDSLKAARRTREGFA